MITNSGLILALIVYFILQLLYKLFIIVIVVALIGRFKAKGKEIINEKMGKGKGDENGEKG